MAEQVLIVGSGFRGIVAAALAAKGGKCVTLTDRAPALGGIMRSEEWNGLFLDKGCHLFSNDDDASTDLLLELMGGAVLPVEFRYACVTLGRLSDAYAIPDLTGIDPAIRARILQELVAAAATRHAPPQTLAEMLAQRYGPTAASQLAPIAAKIFRQAPAMLDASVYWSAPFRRLALLPDDVGAFLKRLPELDDRLAVSSSADPTRFTRGRADKHPFRNFYPAARGMSGFCEPAERRLKELGVTLRLSTTISALSPTSSGVEVRLGDEPARAFDRVVWTLDAGAFGKLLFGEDPLAGLSQPVPMVLYYFLAPEAAFGPYTYVQDFMSDHLLLRVSNAGRYGRQRRPDGTTYLCAEAPTDIDSPVWNDPPAHAAQVWRECVSADAVQGDGWIDLKIVKAPVAYRAGRVGLSAATQALTQRIAAASPHIDCNGQELFVRQDIIARLVKQAAA